MNRRFFIGNAALFSISYLPVIKPLFQMPFKSKDILVLGGTNFVGPAIVNAAIRMGFKVTLLNRGITNPQLFPNLSKFKVDRTKSFLNEMSSHKWDAIIDTWPEDPRIVESAVNYFKDNTNHYIFISTIAAYADFKKAEISEDYPLKKADLFVDGRYPYNKALCESVVNEIFQERCTIIRPGSIIGERDPSYGFRFWTWRVKKGGEIIAPGNGRDIIQFIDVQDIADWIITCISKNIKGVFNMVGPENKLTFYEFLSTCKGILNPDTDIHWADELFLRNNALNNRQDMPLWNSISGDAPGFENISNEKVKKYGIRFKSVETMIKNSLKDYSPNFDFGGSNYGISKEEEANLLRQLKTGI